MRKIISLAICLGLALTVTNCSSKKKKSDEGVSILEPDSGSSADGGMLGGVSEDGSPIDATNTVDPGLSLAISGSDTGQLEGLYTINFGYDKASLTDEARALLASNVDWIKTNSSKIIQLEGHCDERGSTEYNLALGDRRARSVKEYLVSLGIDPNRLVVISYGKEKLVSMGGSDADHAKNRRVNFVPIDQ